MAPGVAMVIRGAIPGAGECYFPPLKGPAGVIWLRILSGEITADYLGNSKQVTTGQQARADWSVQPAAKDRSHQELETPTEGLSPVPPEETAWPHLYFSPKRPVSGFSDSKTDCAVLSH